MSSGLNRSDISDSFEKVNMPKIFQQLTPFFFCVAFKQTIFLKLLFVLELESHLVIWLHCK